MSEEFRQRSIRLRLARMEANPVDPPIPTGFASLDLALGGGLPRGRIVELFGPSSSGKTTLALQIVARFQESGATAAWLDAEHTFDPTYAQALGVAIQNLPLAQPDSSEQAMEIARQLSQSGAVDLVVIDSAAALVPKLELETGLGVSGPGLHARVLASGLHRLSIAAIRSGTSLVFLNQIRSRMETAGGEGETTAGGAPLKLYAGLRIALHPGLGKRVHFRVVKNKVAAAFQEGELAWSSTLGFMETP